MINHPPHHNESPLDHLNHNLERMTHAMSKLTDAMTALGKTIAAAGGAATATHLAAIDEHLTAVDGIETTTKTDIANLKDVQADQAAALQALVDAANGTSSGSGSAGTPSPTTAPGG